MHASPDVGCRRRWFLCGCQAKGGVRGEKTEAKEEKEKTFFLNERLAKTFERRFELPTEAVTDRIAAEFRQGVLIVHAPKGAEAKPRTIEIAAK